MAKQTPSLKARALKYLAAREHSRLELGRKLARYADENDDIEALLDWLEVNKFLSQSRFSESLINRRAQRFGQVVGSERAVRGVEGLEHLAADRRQPNPAGRTGRLGFGQGIRGALGLVRSMGAGAVVMSVIVLHRVHSTTFGAG